MLSASQKIELEVVGFETEVFGIQKPVGDSPRNERGLSDELRLQIGDDVSNNV
ncbi:MAG: hypothetical protein QNJ65_20745 [Xenococcaceae cyanobacterium MO_234.B1]|nr:hypothetical protein [Xenococcaceae cyanobacterium MO_234.B1]